MRSPGLLRGDLLSSPCPSQLSINLDADLDFNSNNLFDTYATPVDQHFSFMPIRGTENHGIDDIMSNNPAFNSAVAKHSPSSGYHGQNAHVTYPNVQGGRNVHGGDWGKPTSQATDFLKKLTEVEDDLLADVHRSSTVEQNLKLQLLHNWAKVIAQRPLQPRKEPALEAGEARAIAHKSLQPRKEPALEADEAIPTTQSNASSHATIKMESPGTPSITP
jgi:hypothetical protein